MKGEREHEKENDSNVYSGIKRLRKKSERKDREIEVCRSSQISERSLIDSLLLCSILASYLNLGLSLLTTPTSSSAALKSIDKTDERQEIANYGSGGEHNTQIHIEGTLALFLA